MKLNLENNLLSIDNYKQILELKHDLIQVENLRIYGTNFKILYLDGYKLIVEGIFLRILLGDEAYDLQNNHEEK